jgi:hypothetical protein
MSTKERAEARRNALLARGGDRLKKLTSTARGEDAPQFAHDGRYEQKYPNGRFPLFADPPLPSLKAFVGGVSPLSAPYLTRTTTSPMFLETPMPSHPVGESFTSASTSVDVSTPHLPSRNPLGTIHTVEIPQPSIPQRMIPLIHVISTILLLGYFIFVYEPLLYGSYEHIGTGGLTSRWSRLAVNKASKLLYTDGVNTVVCRFN